MRCSSSTSSLFFASLSLSLSFGLVARRCHAAEGLGEESVDAKADADPSDARIAEALGAPTHASIAPRLNAPCAGPGVGARWSGVRHRARRPTPSIEECLREAEGCVLVPVGGRASGCAAGVGG